MVASKKKTNKGKGKAKSLKEEVVERVTAPASEPTSLSESDVNRLVVKAGSSESNTEV